MRIACYGISEIDNTMGKVLVLMIGLVNVQWLLLASYRGRLVPCQGIVL
jgi:hypothetical protein